MVFRADDVAARALRLAELHADGRHLCHAAFIEQHVHHKPRFIKPQVFKLDAGQSAHRAGRTVTGHQVTRAHRALHAVILLQIQRDAIGVLLQAGEGHAKCYVHTRQALGMFAQYFFNRWLRKHHGRAVAQRVRRLNRRKALDQLPVHAIKLGRRKRLGVLQHIIHDAELLKHSQDFMVKGYRAGLVIDVSRPVTNKSSQTMAAEQARRYCARGAESDDSDVKNFANIVHAQTASSSTGLTSRPTS